MTAALPPLDLTAVAQQLFTSIPRVTEVAVITIREGHDGADEIDMTTPENGSALELMALSFVQQCLEISALGKDSCEGCAQRHARMKALLDLWGPLAGLEPISDPQPTQH